MTHFVVSTPLSETSSLFFGGAYSRGGEGGRVVHTRKENCVTNLGASYSGELIHGGGGGLFTV